jgi:general secretion pathway protein E/type IV pilus assembly protein PilB
MARLIRTTNKKLGEILLEGGLLDEQQLKNALEEQQRSGELLGEVLLRLGYVAEEDVARTLSMQFALPYISVLQYEISPEALGVFPRDLLRQHLCIPLDRLGKVLVMAVAGPLDKELLDKLEKMSGCEIALYVSRMSEILQVLEGKGGQKK